MTGTALGAVTLNRGEGFVGEQESLRVASGSWFSLLAAKLVDCLVRFRGVSTTKSEESVSYQLPLKGDQRYPERAKGNRHTFVRGSPRPLPEGGARHYVVETRIVSAEVLVSLP